MARPTKVDLETFNEISAWIRKRNALPTRKEMARRHNLSLATLDRFIHGYNPWRDSVTEFDARRSNGELYVQSQQKL